MGGGWMELQVARGGGKLFENTGNKQANQQTRQQTNKQQENKQIMVEYNCKVHCTRRRKTFWEHRKQTSKQANQQTRQQTKKQTRKQTNKQTNKQTAAINGWWLNRIARCTRRRKTAQTRKQMQSTFWEQRKQTIAIKRDFLGRAQANKLNSSNRPTNRTYFGLKRPGQAAESSLLLTINWW